MKTKKSRQQTYLLAAEIMSAYNEALSNLSVEEEAKRYLEEQEFKKYVEKQYDYEFISSRFSCDVLSGLSKLKRCDAVKEHLFPEFFIMKPKQNDGICGWWEDYDVQVRIIAFLLAAELCNK